MTGVISAWIPSKGYGFIRTQTESIFLSLSDWCGESPEQIQEGLSVAFAPMEYKVRRVTKRKACNVRPIVEPTPEPDEQVDF
jgi:cold shock CspA family protein